MRPVIAITMGDYNGIGPEVALKSLCLPGIRKLCAPVLVGSLEVFQYYRDRLRLPVKFIRMSSEDIGHTAKGIPVLDLRRVQIRHIRPGSISKASGKCAGQAIEVAAALCLDRYADAMVTAPVSKEAMHLGGHRFPGQTEMLSRITESSDVSMMMVAGSFRVGLATVHSPLRDVARRITPDLLASKLSILHASLRSDFSIALPKIAVLGLNPHAGENGMLGTEELNTIRPIINKMRRRRMIVDGPFSADGFFGSHAYKGYDAVLAMYHDQGLIPLKMKGFSTGVNFSAGLNVIRTSPDHGTAFEIAGRGIADPGSMTQAIKLAATIVHNRRRD